MAGPTNSEPAIAAALDRVGPRLRRVREERGLTLTRAAQRTGISKSTLSTGARARRGDQAPPAAARRPSRPGRRGSGDPGLGAGRVRQDNAARDLAGGRYGRAGWSMLCVRPIATWELSVGFSMTFKGLRREGVERLDG